MLTKEKVKNFIRETCNPSLMGISDATPFSKEDKERYCNCMGVLKANPIQTNDKAFDCTDFIEDAKSVIVIARNSYFGEMPSSVRGGEKVPIGEIGNFYMNENILNSAMETTGKIVNFLKSNGYQAETPFVGFPQKIKASEAGIGSFGKNTLILNKEYGSWITLSTIITNTPLEPDPPAKNDCGECNLCVDACPTGALAKPYNLDVSKCITFFLCHSKKEIPRKYREVIGVRIGNCTICSDVCPYNKGLEINQKDKMPDGVIYPELIPSLNITEEEYQERYGSKFFDFIMGGRRYFRRNVAIALGNSGKEQAIPELLKAIEDEDELIRSHAAWALGKIGGKKAKGGLEEAYIKEARPKVKQEIELAINSVY